jgi:hypothetical protein
MLLGTPFGSIVNEQLAPPGEALGPEELQRFLHNCSRERRSPTTQRIIDGASYTWIHNFIRAHGEEPTRPDSEWLDPGLAYAHQLGGFFSRVATRIGDRPAGSYAARLSHHFESLARSGPQ